MDDTIDSNAGLRSLVVAVEAQDISETEIPPTMKLVDLFSQNSKETHGTVPAEVVADESLVLGKASMGTIPPGHVHDPTGKESLVMDVEESPTTKESMARSP